MKRSKHMLEGVFYIAGLIFLFLWDKVIILFYFMDLIYFCGTK
jgi:hypothetical protein